ncbi:MAG: ATP-binding cassette domain-containing protein [Hydrogeniiclostridium mannosilyticum]
MEKGIETPVYKEYYADGVEISGGEAQKLAIARALYRQAAFVILDEPTAALDPISEFEIYSRFDSMVGSGQRCTSPTGSPAAASAAAL